jgi:hypothetical protein
VAGCSKSAYVVRMNAAPPLGHQPRVGSRGGVRMIDVETKRAALKAGRVVASVLFVAAAWLPLAALLLALKP